MMEYLNDIGKSFLERPAPQGQLFQAPYDMTRCFEELSSLKLWKASTRPFTCLSGQLHRIPRAFLSTPRSPWTRLMDLKMPF